MMIFTNEGKAFAPIAKAREQIAETQGAIEALDTAPLPADEAMARVLEWINDCGTDSMIGHHLSNWAMAPKPADGPRGFEGWTVGSGAAVDLLRDVSRILAVVCPDKVEASLKRFIDARLADTKPGPPLADRPKIREDLEAKLHKLELAEEREIEKLEAAGHLVHRRPDAKPEIILEDMT